MTNRAAISLYKDVLGYEILDTDKSYYADGEDAYDMKLKFDQPIREADSTADEASATGGNMYHMAESNHQHKPGGGCCGGADHSHAEPESTNAKKKNKKGRGGVTKWEKRGKKRKERRKKNKISTARPQSPPPGPRR